MRIDELPDDIRKRVLYLIENKTSNELIDAFIWALTDEGHGIWSAVDKGNFSQFYDFHAINKSSHDR